MSLESFEMWWTNNLGKETYIHEGNQVDAPSVENFDSWMGDSDSRDRGRVRNHYGEFITFLDAGCGGCPEYYGVKKINKCAKYTGMDITPKLVEYNKNRGIECVQGSLNDIPFPDNSFDIVHSRHVVEHMNNIEKPLDELVRVGIKKVLISFFIKPSDQSEHTIQLDNKGTSGEVHHNVYSKKIIEEKLKNNIKVKNIKWVDIPKPSKELLIITL